MEFSKGLFSSSSSVGIVYLCWELNVFGSLDICFSVVFGEEECMVPENIHTPPREGFLLCTPPPHPLGISIPRESLMTPSPQECPCYANMIFVVTLINIQHFVIVLYCSHVCHPV